jgi:hypothetical protein
MGATPGRESTAALHDLSSGNPFLLGELVRLVASDGPIDQAAITGDLIQRMPDEVRTILRRRLETL